MISQWRENQEEATSYTLSELRAYAVEYGWNLWEAHKRHCVNCAGDNGYCAVGRYIREQVQSAENAYTDVEDDRK